jgi:hypothetical protein
MDDAAKRLTVPGPSTRALVAGPGCRCPTRRRHRREVRTGAERPWGPGRLVRRRYGRQCFGAQGRGTRRMVPARLAPLVAPGARRTPRRGPWWGHSAWARAGRAGARLRRHVGLAGRRHPLGRLRRRLPLPAVATPHGRGVDEWAARKRQPSGTVRLALARRRPRARWPEREAQPFALGGQAHPGVGVIARARCRASAAGAQPGAPDALQGAARSHRRQHLAAALDPGCHAHGHRREAVPEALPQAPVARPGGRAGAPPPRPRTAPALAPPRQARRLALQQQRGA